MPIAYKVMNGAETIFGRDGWHLPKGARPGKWMPKIEGYLAPCCNGYHLSRPRDLLEWLGPDIYEAEWRGDMIEAGDKIVVREARLIRRLASWDDRAMRLFAADCAERVLPIFEATYPDDDRVCRAIQAARDFAEGRIDEAARSAAEDAAWAAAFAAVRPAAGAAASAAAMSAAMSAAGDAARSAVRSAVRSAAWAAARSAAGGAAWAAARSARSVERQWQTDRLMEILEITP